MFSFCLQRISYCCEIFCCHLVELMLKVPSLQCSADVSQSLDTLIFSMLLIPESLNNQLSVCFLSLILPFTYK